MHLLKRPRLLLTSQFVDLFLDINRELNRDAEESEERGTKSSGDIIYETELLFEQVSSKIM